MPTAAWIELVCEVLGGIVAFALIVRGITRWGRKVIGLLFSIDDRLARLERHDTAHTRQINQLERKIR